MISDGTGLVVIGEATAVERFLEGEGIESSELAIPRLSAVMSTGFGVSQAGSGMPADSGQWVELTEESAAAAHEYGLASPRPQG